MCVCACENKKNEQHHPHSRHILCENSVIISTRIINDVQTSQTFKLKFKCCLNDTSNHSLNFKSSFFHFVLDTIQRGIPNNYGVFIQRNPTRYNSVSKFIIPYLYKAQHVSGDAPPIIRSLKLHQQPLVLHTWKVFGRCGCWTLSASSNHNVQQPSTYAKPEAAGKALGSWWWAVRRPKHVELRINTE